MPHTQLDQRTSHMSTQIMAVVNEAVVAIDDIEDESVTPMGAAHAFTGAGAVDVTVRTNLITSSGAAQAITLADGTVDGQRVRIVHTADGGSIRLTAGGSLHLDATVATITLANRFDWIELEWLTDAWRLIGVGGIGTIGVTLT